VTATLYYMDWSCQTAGSPQAFYNNIGAYTQDSAIGASRCPPFPPTFVQFTSEQNLFYLDIPVSGGARIQNLGDTWFGTGAPTLAQVWQNNMYWNTNEDYTTEPNLFTVQNSSDCMGGMTNFSFAQWQAFGEDQGTVIQDPGFTNPSCSYTTAAQCVADPTQDNYTFSSGAAAGQTIPIGSSGQTFTVFDVGAPGRNNPVISVPAVPATWPIAPYSAATGF